MGPESFIALSVTHPRLSFPQPLDERHHFASSGQNAEWMPSAVGVHMEMLEEAPSVPAHPSCSWPGFTLCPGPTHNTESTPGLHGLFSTLFFETSLGTPSPWPSQNSGNEKNLELSAMIFRSFTELTISTSLIHNSASQENQKKHLLGFSILSSSMKTLKVWGEFVKLKVRDLKSLLISHVILWVSPFCWEERIHG